MLRLVLVYENSLLNLNKLNEIFAICLFDEIDVPVIHFCSQVRSGTTKKVTYPLKCHDLIVTYHKRSGPKIITKNNIYRLVKNRKVPQRALTIDDVT